MKALIKDETFVLKDLSLLEPITNIQQVLQCVSTPLGASTPRQQSGIKLLLCIWSGKRHILQLQGILFLIENMSIFWLGHLRQGKYSGSWPGRTMKQCLQTEPCNWHPALQMRLTNMYRSPAKHSITLWPQAKLCYTKPECATLW